MQHEVVQNGSDIELIEKDNNIDMDKSQADGKSYKEIEEEETSENTSQEQDKKQNKKQSQLEVDIIPNVTIKSNKELAASLNINAVQKQNENPEDFVLCTDKKERDRKVETSEISEKIQTLQDNVQDDDLIESLNLFENNVVYLK